MAADDGPAPAPTAADEGEPISLSSFSEYKRAVLGVVGALQQLREFSVELNLQKNVELVDDMLRRIEENSFSIAVVGEFKRGKSTFINALLGRDILPSDIMPCSATLNRVTYGIKPAVTIKFKDGREEQVGVDQLSDYVTKLTPESERNALSIKEATVQYPVTYCQNNVEIIDTPGLNDDDNMTSVTLSVLPAVDAAVLVIMAQSPFSEYERDFLENKLLTSDLGKVIFVVTAIDRLHKPGDADRVINHIRERIGKHVMDRAAEQFGRDSDEYELYLRKIGEPKVFGLSAHQALEAKLGNDPESLAASRFGAFESALEKFLSEDRGAVFLQVPVNRVAATANEVLSAIAIREGALQMRADEFAAAHEKAAESLEGLRAQKQQEMLNIDRSAQEIERQVKPLIDDLDRVMKETAARVIDAEDVGAAEIASAGAIEQLTARLGDKIAKAVQAASQRHAEKIQSAVQTGVVLEADRLREFADAVDATLQSVELQFSGAAPRPDGVRTSTGEGISAALSIFTGFGGIWSGYRVAGVKGAAAGGAASLATFLGAGLVVGIIGAPFTLPLIVVTGVASIFTGGWLTRAIFGGDRVQNFKDNYKAALLEQIDRQVLALGTERKVHDHITAAFAALKRKVHEEIEATLADTQATLAEMRLKQERNETLGQAQGEQLNKMRAQAQALRAKADALNNQLVKILAA